MASRRGNMYRSRFDRAETVCVPAGVIYRRTEQRLFSGMIPVHHERKPSQG